MRRAALTLALALLCPPAHAQAPLAAQACLGCHGATPIPAIAGRPAADLATAMAEFRANQRPATIMDRIARGYTEAEITALATYFASLPAGEPQ